MRALAHIETIVQTYPIEGADRVEMAQVLDWHVLVKKGQFKSGDVCVYIEVDAILPDGLSTENKVNLKEKKKDLKAEKDKDRKAIIEDEINKIKELNTIPIFEFLRDCDFTIEAKKYGKLGIISQGILFQLDEILPTIKQLNPEFDLTLNVGDDITSLLRIEKVVEDIAELKEQETPSWVDRKLMKYSWYRKYKKFKKKFEIKSVWQPFFPPESDETNIQKIFSRLKAKYGNDPVFYKTAKLEGQNYSAVRFEKKIFGIFAKKYFGICSHHRFMLKDDGSDFWKTAKKLKLKDRLDAIGKNLFIRGEHIGPKIQGNIYRVDETDLYLFEVWDIDNQRFYNLTEFKEFCEKYNFKHVPILEENVSLPDTVQEILDDSNGKSVLYDTLEEGKIWRTFDMSMSFKAKSPEYLTKQKSRN